MICTWGISTSSLSLNAKIRRLTIFLISGGIYSKSLSLKIKIYLLCQLYFIISVKFFKDTCYLSIHIKPTLDTTHAVYAAPRNFRAYFRHWDCCMRDQELLGREKIQILWVNYPIDSLLGSKFCKGILLDISRYSIALLNSILWLLNIYTWNQNYLNFGIVERVMGTSWRALLNRFSISMFSRFARAGGISLTLLWLKVSLVIFFMVQSLGISSKWIRFLSLKSISAFGTFWASSIVFLTILDVILIFEM